MKHYFFILLSIIALVYADSKQYGDTYKCQVMQICNNDKQTQHHQINICTYYCTYNNDEPSFIKYQMQNVKTIDEAYNAWLGRVDSTLPLLATLPKTESKTTQYTKESLLIRYSWESPNHIRITFIENNNITALVELKQEGGQYIVYDGLSRVD